MQLRIGTALALLILFLGLMACDKQQDGDDVATFEEALCPFELPGSVVQGRDILCGYVTVPEEHARPDGETVRLAVAVLKSTGDDSVPDPLVIESGGPGNSTLAGVPSLLGRRTCGLRATSCWSNSAARYIPGHTCRAPKS
jgi:hypothetical protein